MTDRMTSLWSWFGEELTGNLLFTMLHFLWQAAVVAGLAWLMATALKRAAPKVHYLIYCTAMCSLPVCLAITFFVSSASTPARATILNSEMVSASRLDSTQTNTGYDASTNQLSVVAVNNPVGPRQHGFAMQFPNAARWIVCLYLLGVACFLMRLLAGVWGGSRLRTRATVIRDTGLCQQIADQAKQMRLRGVPVVAYCQCVAVPTVVGLLRPMILLPTSLMTGLTPSDLNAILRHEFAHIRRYDLWVNLGQRILESLLFFHPAVWWLSRRISSERELCCDDVVVSSGFLSIDYAGALLRMAERCAEANCAEASRAGATPAGVMKLAADGQDPSLLEQRIQRLIEGTSSSHAHLHRGGLAALVLMLMALVLIPGATMQFARAQNPAPDQGSDSVSPDSAPAKNPTAARNDSDPFGSDGVNPFIGLTQTQKDAANNAAFPPGIFGDEDHESTKKNVLRWIAQSGSDIAAEREAVAQPLAKYFGVSKQVEDAVLRLTRDKDKSVRATASLVLFQNSGSLNRDAKTIERVLHQVVFGMVRDDVHSEVITPFLVEKLKTEREGQRAFALLIHMMLRQGHTEVLDQVIQGKEDPKIANKNGYYRFIEFFKDEQTKQLRAKHNTVKHNAANGGSPKGSAKGMAPARDLSDPFGSNPFGTSDSSDPFGPQKPDNIATIANNAIAAFAALEEPAIVAELSLAEARIFGTFSDETDVSFIRTPLHQALQTISSQHDIPIVLNQQALKKVGLTANVPVSLDLRNVSLRSTLRLLLREHKLEMLVRDEILQITTVADMRATSVSRKYHTDQLPYNGTDIARSLQRVLDAQTIAGDTKPVVEYLSGNAGKPGIIWVQANEAAQRESLVKLNWLLNK